MKKPRIYCSFTGTGKTYFCQHHSGGADIDEEPSVKAQLHPRFLSLVFECYLKYGYKIITNATPYVFMALQNYISSYEIIVILPPPTMKEEILQRVYNRGDIEWHNYLKSIYDEFYQNTITYPIDVKKIGLKPGQYLEDIIRQEEENLD